jgi:uncharacterized protein YaiE (UPF0345 family)
MRLFAAAFFVANLAAGGAAFGQAPTAPPAPPAPPSGVVLQAPSYSRYEAAREVQLRDVIAFVRVRPEARGDVSVAVINHGPLAAPRVRLAGDRLVIDGGLRRQIASCDVSGAEGFTVRTRRGQTLTTAQIPIIELRVPREVVLAANGAVRLHVGPSDRAEIQLGGCGDADVERVSGAVDISLSGTPDLRLYDAGEVTAAVAGQGDVVLGVARRGLTLSIAGTGDVVASRVDGPTSIAIQGAGDVLIRDGRASAMSVAIAGAGDVTHNGSAERLDVTIFGAGDVHVREVTGEVSRRIFGGGEVTIGR